MKITSRDIYPTHEEALAGLEKYESELDRAADILQKTHPMGYVVGIGLLRVATATKDVCDELAALRERVKRLERAIRQARPELRCCANQLAAKGMIVHPEGSVQRAIDAMTAALAEPDPTPLRTCLELLAQLGVEAQHLNRAGDNEALRAMAGRLQQVREGL